MTEVEIIDLAYDDSIKEAARKLFEELIADDHKGWHVSAERRFVDKLKAAAMARDRAKALIVEAECYDAKKNGLPLV